MCWTSSHLYLFNNRRAKEYSTQVAACTEPLRVESSMRTGKIITTLTVPDDALPSMTTTKIITIHYYLLILFDMRTKTSFMESRSPKKIDNKLRNKLLSSPGGFQIEVPVIIGTLSDNIAGHQLRKITSRPSPTLSSPPNRQLHANRHSPPGRFSAAPPAPDLGRLTNPVRTGFGTEGLLQPVMASRFSTLPARNREDSLPDQRALYSAFRNRSFAGHLPINSLNGLEYKPLPVLPRIDDRYKQGYGSGLSAGSSSRSFPPLNGHNPYAYPNSPSSSTRSSSSSGPSSSSRMRPNIGRPPPLSVPPLLPPRPREEGGHLSNHGYPIEKYISPPQINMPLPIAISVEMPTAPLAVDLGLGPASPAIEGGIRWGHVRSNSAPSTPVQSPASMDYFQYMSPPSTGGGSTSIGGEARVSEVASAPPAPPYSLMP